MKTALERDVRLVRSRTASSRSRSSRARAKTLVQDLQRKLSEWTGRRWMVVVSAEAGAPTVSRRTPAKQSALEQGVRADPLVQAVLARFPGAEIVGVRRREMPPAGHAAAAREPWPRPGRRTGAADGRRQVRRMS